METTHRKKWLIAVFAVVFVLAFLLAWVLWLSPEAREYNADRANYELAMNALSTYETAMKNDTYGGKTPQETLDLFVDALKKDDLDLAVKYFILEENGEVNKELSKVLVKTKEDNQLNLLINFLSNSESYPEDRIYEGDYKFVSKNQNGEIELYIDFEFNKYSGIWKIEDLL